MLGQLQDGGNTTTLAHYLELLAGAGMLTSLQKFSGFVIRIRGSSPKLQVPNTALMTAMLGLTPTAVRAQPELWGALRRVGDRGAPGGSGGCRGARATTGAIVVGRLTSWSRAPAVVLRSRSSRAGGATRCLGWRRPGRHLDQAGHCWWAPTVCLCGRIPEQPGGPVVAPTCLLPPQ